MENKEKFGNQWKTWEKSRTEWRLIIAYSCETPASMSESMIFAIFDYQRVSSFVASGSNLEWQTKIATR